MRKYRNKLSALILATTALLFGTIACAAEQIGSILQFEGQCSISRKGQSIPAANGFPVQLNDKAKTGLQSKLTIRFKDDTELMLGPLSSAVIDTYVFGGSDSNLLFKFTTGTFRAVTGELVKRNPEGFNMQTPLTTLGIRGSDIYALVGMIGEEVGAMDLGPGHTLEISTSKQTTKISKPGLRSKILPNGIISPPSPIPPRILNQMKKLAEPPTTPKVGSHQKTVPRVPTPSVTTKSVVTPPPPPAPQRHPRIY